MAFAERCVKPQITQLKVCNFKIILFREINSLPNYREMYDGIEA